MTEQLKTLDTLVEDIYKLFENGYDMSDDEANEIGMQVASTVKRRFKEIKESKEQEQKEYKLRLSQIGKPLYQIWCEMKGIEKEKMPPFTHNKFLFGDIIEILLLSFAKMAGHTVEREQEEVELEGVKGHIDAFIDGVLIDVKSAAPMSFKKFKDGTYLDGGGFADSYKYQISAYAEATNNKDNVVAFLAQDKVSGQLALMEVHASELPDAKKKIQELKSIDLDKEPEYPYLPIADGSSGNMKLPPEASYDPFKWFAFRKSNEGGGLRCFLYSNGPRYLTSVVREPLASVPEIDEKGNSVDRDPKETF